ncbi:hypothetical protein [Gemmatimonas phototrophica]|uniref:DUF2306 domain-containing protein n=1 Tax=Gemmatimonas phototrophica TaxID=1379270 RepID=A0A143BLE4_9BACT|nr:hypothetical protein [Gemmatimonas phototrophica]AMW05351.1 hypothetical protein GEMMAAP_12170 [Gemmatimonas phototrophica]
MWPFEGFLFVHVTTGAVGLLLFWIPVLGKKGSPTHRKFGEWYARLMLVTASMAIGMASTTLLSPIVTHPKQVALNWPQSRIEGIFGWMMLYLAIMTIHLVWHGIATIRNKKNHPANRHWANVSLNVFTIFAALVCAYRGWLINETLMMGFSLVGIASGLTNLWFIYTPEPSRIAYQLEHIKSIVGSGISVYTAFMAFGFVRLNPGNALNPKMWAIPLGVGLVIIIYQQTRLRLAFRRPRSAPAGATSKA